MASHSIAILDDFRRIVQVLRQSSRAAEIAIGVSGAQLFVLKALSEAPAQSLNALAKRTRTHQSTVSVVVKRLVDRGLVRRATSTRDGRRVELNLTSRGRRLLERAPLAAQDRLIEGIDALSVDDRRALSGALHRLVRAMRLGKDSPDMFFEDPAAMESSRGGLRIGKA